MKTRDPLFKKQGEKIPLKELKHKAFSFLPVSLYGVLVFFICYLMSLKILIISVNFTGL